MTEWWQDFFDHAYVEAWSAGGAFDRTTEQVQQLVELLALAPGARVLDVPCGFGRMAGPLSERGYDVTGADLSAVQLEIAAERHPGPSYVRADMREPPGAGYDAVLNLFSSFGYFEDRADDIDALRAWFRVLRPGGVLVMELMHRDRVAYLAGQPPGDLTSEVKETGETDWVTGVRTATVTYRDLTKTFRVRLYTATELVELLRELGFGPVAAYGDLTGVPLTPHTRLVLTAEKPGADRGAGA